MARGLEDPLLRQLARRAWLRSGLGLELGLGLGLGLGLELGLGLVTTVEHLEDVTR